MKTIELNANTRESLAKSTTKKLRKEGKVPGVIYRNDQASHIYMDYAAAKKILFTADTYLVKLNLDGTVRDAIVREAQYHPVTEKVIHLDLMAVADDKPITLDLPIKLIGSPAGVKEGGKLVPKLRRLTVKGLVSKLPESISIDVSELKLGSTIKVGDAKIEDLDVVTPPTAAVASVEIPRALRSAGLEEGEGLEGEGEGTEEAAEA
ncbi:UNVERIFIED_CONTAM: hypothetical protein GTU68_048076 [Idotea baltica]|nr:hypothetical protein [Idotea baltica]